MSEWIADTVIVLRDDLAQTAAAAAAAADISGEDAEREMWGRAPLWSSSDGTQYRVTGPRMRQVDLDALPAKLEQLTQGAPSRDGIVEGLESRGVFEAGALVACYVIGAKLDHPAILAQLGLERVKSYGDP